MGKLLDGLFLYEIILMILGTILFLAIVSLILKQKEINKNHLLGLGIAILSVGFPGIKSFSITDGMLKIEKSIEELEANPANKEAQEALEKGVVAVQERPIKNSERLVTLSEANLELGHTDKAVTQAKTALESNPKSQKAEEVIKVVAVEKQIKEVRSNPSDKKAKDRLKKDVRKLEKLKTPSGRRTAHIAEVYEVLGDKAKARAYIDSTRMYQPKNLKIQEIERRLPLDPGTRE